MAEKVECNFSLKMLLPLLYLALIPTSIEKHLFMCCSFEMVTMEALKKPSCDLSI